MKRFAAVNSEIVTTHFAVLEELVRKHGIGASCLWNLEETAELPATI